MDTHDQAIIFIVLTLLVVWCSQFGPTAGITSGIIAFLIWAYLVDDSDEGTPV